MPLDDATWFFRESEFRQLFSERIVNRLVSFGKKYEPEGVELPHQDFHFFPATSDLPVLLAVRLSLSFPFLLAAIPALPPRLPAAHAEVGQVGARAAAG